VEEVPQLVLRIDTISKGTAVEAEATLSMGAGAGEARERLQAIEEDTCQKRARPQ
jgi:hypothetical protein